MQNPKSLRLYPVALDLAVAIYRTTDAFPRVEQFGLTSQLRRSAISIGSNVAEGCGRRTDGELVTFLHYAHGSASELEFQLEVAKRLEFGDPESLRNCARTNEDAKKMLCGLLRSITG